MAEPRAYGAWDARQQAYTSFAYNEQDIHRIITVLMTKATGVALAATGRALVLAAPMTLTAPIIIPKECPGLTIYAASKFPITAQGVIATMFDVRAEMFTVRDLLAYSPSTSNMFTAFVTASATLAAGRSNTKITIQGNDVFADRLYVDSSAGQAADSRIINNRQVEVNGAHGVPVVVDSPDCVVAFNDLNQGGADTITLAANAQRCALIGNDCNGGSITTSASGGSNRLAANVNTGAKTLAASDIDDDAPVVSGRLIRAPQVLTAGTSYAKPAGCNSIVVELVGGGGGGGGCSSAASSGACGGGGASGAYASKRYDVSALAGPFTYAIGSAGLAGTNAGGTGGNGGDTTFTDGTTLVTAKGGLGGVGEVAGTTAAFVAGGAGQLSTNGDLNGAGSPGEYAQRISGTAGVSGGGGSSEWGGGGLARTAAGAGNAGQGIGGGGGGAMVLSASAAAIGGAGSAGALRIWEFT